MNATKIRNLMLASLCVFVAVLGAKGDQSTPTSLAGAYRWSIGTEGIDLALLPNGAYLAHWSVDIFPDNGSASGKWLLDGDEIHLIPEREDGALKGHLRVLVVRRMEGETALRRKEDAQFDKNPFAYFYPKHPEAAALSDQDKKFFAEIRRAILGDQPTAVAKLVIYPIEIVIDSKTVTFTSEQDFILRYKHIVTADLRRVVRDQKADELFKNWRGIMVARGELWFGEVKRPGDTSFVYRITGISPIAIHD